MTLCGCADIATRELELIQVELLWYLAQLKCAALARTMGNKSWRATWFQTFGLGHFLLSTLGRVRTVLASQGWTVGRYGGYSE